MPETTVAALNAKYIADSSQFTKGLGEVDGALKRTKSIIRDAETPMTRYEKKLQDIVINLREGKITQDQATRATQKANAAYERATVGSQKYNRTLGNQVMELGKLAISMAVVRQALSMLFEQYRKIATLTRAAKFLGTTTQELESYRDIGQEAGISTQTMDTAVQRMTKRMAKASVGIGEAVRSLKELGINAKDLAGKSTWEFGEILADALSKIPDEATRLRLAVDIFDSEGARLGNTLGDLGKEGMQKYNDRQKDFIALSKEQIAETERVNTALDDLGKIWDNLKSQLAAGFAAPLRGIAMAFVNIGKLIANVFNIGPLKNIVSVARSIGMPIISIIKGFGRLAEFISFALKPLAPMGERINTIFSKLGDIVSKLTQAVGGELFKVLAKLASGPLWVLGKLLESINYLLDGMIWAIGKVEDFLGFSEGGKATKRSTQEELAKPVTAATIAGTPSLERGSQAAFSFLQGLQRDRIAEQLRVQEEQLAVQKQIAVNTSSLSTTIPSGAAVAVG